VFLNVVTRIAAFLRQTIELRKHPSKPNQIQSNPNPINPLNPIKLIQTQSGLREPGTNQR
jgi:hypothetical protein